MYLGVCCTVGVLESDTPHRGDVSHTFKGNQGKIHHTCSHVEDYKRNDASGFYTRQPMSRCAHYIIIIISL